MHRSSDRQLQVNIGYELYLSRRFGRGTVVLLMQLVSKHLPPTFTDSRDCMPEYTNSEFLHGGLLLGNQQFLPKVPDKLQLPNCQLTNFYVHHLIHTGNLYIIQHTSTTTCEPMQTMQLPSISSFHNFSIAFSFHVLTQIEHLLIVSMHFASLDELCRRLQMSHQLVAPTGESSSPKWAIQLALLVEGCHFGTHVRSFK